MRRSLAVAGIIAAGLTALAVAATPAFAAGGPLSNNNNNGTGTCAITGTAPTNMGMNGGGQGNGRGNGMGQGMGGGMAGQALAPSGTLTTAQKSTLAYMAEEEKLAHDVYVALAAKFPVDYQFARIARSETMHQAALRTLLTRYGLTDPTAGLADGVFSTKEFQTLYNDLVGSATTAANALGVGVTIEKLDIADLTAALTGLTAPDVTQVYTNLRTGSQHLSLIHI